MKIDSLTLSFELSVADEFSDAAPDAGIEVQSKDEDPEFGEVDGGKAKAGSPFNMPSMPFAGTDKIVERVNQTIRRRNVPETPATPISADDKQFDMDGDGILDENEKMLKNMYKGRSFYTILICNRKIR